MKKVFAVLVFFVFQMICSDIYGKEVPTTKSYYVIDGFCCGGEDSDPHAVFGIEASDGYILLGKSLDKSSKEDGFAVKIRKNLPNEKLFLHPEEENTYDWSIVTGEKGKRDGFNAAAILDNHIFIAGYKETKKNIIDRYLIKVDLRNGDIVWSQSFPSSMNGRSSAFESVVVTNKNGLLLTGVTNSSYDAMEGFKSYGNPTDGNAFSMHFSNNLLMSKTSPEEPSWEKEYKNLLTGKSIKRIGNTNEFLIASSTNEPMVAKVLKIKEDGTTVWKKRYPQHGELTDIAVTTDGYFLSGHKESFKGGIDGSITKISPNGLVIWNKVFGNPEGGTNNFFSDFIVSNELIFDECWSIVNMNNSGVVVACGTGIEECDTLRGQKRRDCEKDPRQTWRSYLVNINFDGDIIWEKTGSFVFPGEEDSEDLASVAAEWVFINSKDQIASVNDLEFGIGLEIIELDK